MTKRASACRSPGPWRRRSDRRPSPRRCLRRPVPTRRSRSPPRRSRWVPARSRSLRRLRGSPRRGPRS
ncbi:MAG TPA: hypothetical protein DHW40_07410 [Microbacterium sp.]|nr:hypothetical protein [Microbacterium sp.]